MTTALRTALAFLAAVIATAAAASAVQTQVNLSAIASLGAPISLPIRLTATAQDLMRFGPVMAAIAAGALLLAFAIARVAACFAPPAWRQIVYALAGVVGLWAAFFVMGFFTPMPTLVMAVRGPIGLALVCATGLIGGLVFTGLTTPRTGVAR